MFKLDHITSFFTKIKKMTLLLLYFLTLFLWISESRWMYKSTLIPEDGIAFDQFGSNVALNNNYLVVGAQGRNNRRGSVYIYQRTTTNTFIFEQTILPRATGNIFFGNDVDINNNNIIVAGSLNGEFISIIRQDQNGTWTEVQEIIHNNNGDKFGQTVAINNDNFIFVGAPFEDEKGRADSGTVYIYKQSTNIQWQLLEKIQGYGVDTDGNFGKSIGVYGSSVVIR